jgi:hypothetical protein
MTKICPEGKILNPITGRCVNKNGKIGKKIIAGENRRQQPSQYSTAQHKPPFIDYSITRQKCTNFQKARGWKIERKLGNGVQGTAYKTCYYQDCNYVFKVFRFRENNTEIYNEFISEVAALKELNEKVPKCVPKMYGSWACDGQGVIAMELMTYDLEKVKKLSYKTVQDLLKQLYNVGWLHVDTHRGNVMFRKDGSPVLIDFGYSVKRGQSLKNHPWNIDNHTPFNFTELKYLQDDMMCLSSFGDHTDPSVVQRYKKADEFFNARIPWEN